MSHFFTLDEANTLIPLLEELLSRIQIKDRQYRRHHEQLLMVELVSSQGSGRQNLVEAPGYLEKSCVLDQLVASLEEDWNQLSQREIMVRDLELGWVDIPFLQGGEQGYLSWKRGEKACRFWHGWNENYRIRQPLDVNIERCS